MKDEYLIWKRFLEACKEQITQAEGIQEINKHCVLMANKKILELERAGKVPKNANPKTKP